MFLKGGMRSAHAFIRAAMEEKNGKKKAPALGDWGVQFWPVGIRRP
jgi:hypothetical protein